MLVITRRLSESIQIGENIRVMVVAIRGDRIRLGIEAPKAVTIMRPDAKRKKKT